VGRWRPEATLTELVVRVVAGRRGSTRPGTAMTGATPVAQGDGGDDDAGDDGEVDEAQGGLARAVHVEDRRPDEERGHRTQADEAQT
jgi:hypothetical protein